jgi:two-component system CheB/CheR fusion protein
MLSSGLNWMPNPGVGEVAKKSAPLDFAELTRRQLLVDYAPASVLVDAADNILYVHGETGHFLRPAPGQATLHVAEMAREGLQGPIREALKRVRLKGKPVLRSGIKVLRHGQVMLVDLAVRPVASLRSPQGLVLLTFLRPATPGKAEKAGKASNVAKPGKGLRARLKSGAAQMDRVQELTRELVYSRESLQATIEEQQTSQEELQSTNEEMQSTNEEVSASNEELETAKEELQSVNEELTTVNAELQAKVEQLTWIQDDMKNLFDATNVGTIFLDEALRIKRFTREAGRIYRLGPADTGRPLADIKSNLVGPDLLAEAQAVLDDLVPVERQVRSIAGAWYLARLLPYRTTENAIRGVVITFTDISERFAAEAASRLGRELAERVVEATSEPLLVLDGGLRVVSANAAFHATFGTPPESTVGRHIYELADRRWDLPALRQLLEQVLPRDQAFERFAVTETAPDGTATRRLIDGRRIGGGEGAAALILLAFHQ